MFKHLGEASKIFLAILAADLIWAQAKKGTFGTAVQNLFS